MKEFNVNYTLSMDEYSEVQIYHMMRRSNIVKFCVILFAIGIVMVVSGIVTDAGVNGSWILVAFPIPYLIYIYLKMKNITVRMYKGDIKNWELYFSEDGVNIKGGRKCEMDTMPWSCVIKKWNTKKYLYLFLSKKVFIPIPKRSLTEEQTEYILKKTENHILTKEKGV